MGVNWLFAPVADVNNNPDNPIINIRSFGENPEQVASFVEAYINGAHSDRKNPVLVTAKHFPGHGDTTEDSHLALPRLDADHDRIEAVELAPFRSAIAAGVDAVMTAHLAVPALEPDNVPATVSSKIITGVLRDELGFHGLVVTDAMEMQGLSSMFDSAEASVRAIEAGADVLLMPKRPEEAIRGLVAAVEKGRISRKRLDESVNRVLAAKARLGLQKQETGGSGGDRRRGGFARVRRARAGGCRSRRDAGEGFQGLAASSSSGEHLPDRAHRRTAQPAGDPIDR